MEIRMPDGYAKVVNDPQELSQPSFGVDPLEDWPCYMNAAPKPAFQLFLTTPNNGKIEALERAGIYIMHKQDIDTHRHYILVDKDNLNKLEAYLKSNTAGVRYVLKYNISLTDCIKLSRTSSRSTRVV
jgi:hypothetical protein